MLNIKDLKLGSTVKDASTGFQGMAKHRARYLTGTDQVYIEGKYNEEKGKANGEVVDIQLVDYVDEGLSARAIIREWPCGVVLGTVAKNKITKYKGTIIGLVEYFNGCHQVILQTEIDKDGKHIDAEQCDVAQLIIIPAVPPTMPPPPENPADRTGGPQTPFSPDAH